MISKSINQWPDGPRRSRSLHERALNARRAVLGEEHPRTLTAINNLAVTLSAEGDLVGARALHEQALSIRRRVLGEEHPSTLVSMENVAQTLYAQGDPKKAHRIYEQVLETSRRILGPEHPDTVRRASICSLLD